MSIHFDFGRVKSRLFGIWKGETRATIIRRLVIYSQRNGKYVGGHVFDRMTTIQGGGAEENKTLLLPINEVILGEFSWRGE